jgi:hypothetical protein
MRVALGNDTFIESNAVLAGVPLDGTYKLWLEGQPQPVTVHGEAVQNAINMLWHDAAVAPKPQQEVVGLLTESDIKALDDLIARLKTAGQPNLSYDLQCIIEKCLSE